MGPEGEEKEEEEVKRSLKNLSNLARWGGVGEEVKPWAISETKFIFKGKTGFNISNDSLQIDSKRGMK